MLVGVSRALASETNWRCPEERFDPCEEDVSGQSLTRGQETEQTENAIDVNPLIRRRLYYAC